jgi:hypothetical protein
MRVLKVLTAGALAALVAWAALLIIALRGPSSGPEEAFLAEGTAPAQAVAAAVHTEIPSILEQSDLQVRPSKPLATSTRKSIQLSVRALDEETDQQVSRFKVYLDEIRGKAARLVGETDGGVLEWECPANDFPLYSLEVRADGCSPDITPVAQVRHGSQDFIVRLRRTPAPHAPLPGEYRGGLVDVALPALALGKTWRRNVLSLEDPKAEPQERLPGNGEREEGPRRFFRQMLRDVGDEAWLEVEYYDVWGFETKLHLRIERFETNAKADHQWQVRGRGSHLSRTDPETGVEIQYSETGHRLPGGVVSRSGSVCLKQGRFIIGVSPGQPDANDPGLMLARRTATRAMDYMQP